MHENRKRICINEFERNAFFQFPQFFIYSDDFIGLSCEAMVLYSVLKSRHELSRKNGWINENGEIYLIMTREEMCSLIRKSKPTVIKAMKDLKKYDLIDEERLGRGKPNLIFLLEPVILVNSQKSNSFTSRSKDFLPLEVKNLYPIYKDVIYNDNIYSQSISHIDKLNTSDKTNRQDIHNKKESNILISNIPKENKNNTSLNKNSNQIDYTTMRKIVQGQIHYDYLILDCPLNKSIIDNILDIIIDINLSEDNTVKIGNSNKPKDLVLGIINKADMEEIKFVINKYSKQYKRIKNPQKYILTMLYNCVMEMSLECVNEVNVDFIE